MLSGMDNISVHFALLASEIATAGLNLVMLQAVYGANGEVQIQFQIYGDPETVNRVNEIQAQVARRTGIQQ
jgi:hypothetical protein